MKQDSLVTIETRVELELEFQKNNVAWNQETGNIDKRRSLCKFSAGTTFVSNIFKPQLVESTDAEPLNTEGKLYTSSTEKFQQKAVKQTKQKKSKSAEFLMVKEDREAMEGTGNPAFNMSSPDLSAYQTSEKNVIRCDSPARTLAAHPQEFRLLASAEPKGNEYSRNYFDPLMDEEINPRQCGMEVSREGDDTILYNRLMKLFDDSRQGEPQDGSTREETLDSEVLKSSKSQEIYREADEATPSYIEEFEKYAQKDVILLGSSPLQQDLKFEGEGLISTSQLKTDGTFGKTPGEPYITSPNICKKDRVPKLGALTVVTDDSKGTTGPCWKVEQSQPPQPLQIRIKCIRGLKDKVPQGFYRLRASLLGRPGGCVLPWWQTEQLKTRTHPVRHGGNFYDVGLYFHESLCVALPQQKAVKPGLALLFELFLLRGTCAGPDHVVGWAVFPLCDNNFDVVEGKFKCPLLRGHYDQNVGSFRKIEDLICLDLDNWLGNLYFQVIKLPLHLDDQNHFESNTQLSAEFPVSLMTEAEKAEIGMDNPAGFSEKERKNIWASTNDETESTLESSPGSISDKIGPCPKDCDLSLLKEDHGLHSKGKRLTDHLVQEKSAVWITEQLEDRSQDTPYLEELEEHRLSVCCSSVADRRGSGEFVKHLHFVLMSVFSELRLAQWQSQSFWCIILLTASLWFPRLYLHYLGQWLFLQAISVPVTKFQPSLHTVELCYPASSLHSGEELPMVVVGTLLLNALILLLVLVKWGCQLLFASCPDVLSKLITTMAVWTVLDPLAVFIVDIFLGRFTYNEEAPVADAAKLYWMFVRTKQLGILGVMVTMLLYIFLLIISSLILYLYCLRLRNDSWISDAFQRIHSEEVKFFMPYDLEISNQELSYIVKRSEQWRGINGERRKVAVSDYIWKSPGLQSSVASCDLQHQNGISVSARGPGDVTSYVSIYTVYPSGFQELYRHFLRCPGGAIVEVFGDIGGLKLVQREVITAIQDHISEMDTVLGDAFDIKTGDMRRMPSNKPEIGSPKERRV